MKKILYITLAAATIFPMSCQKQTEAISSQSEATPFVIRGVIDDSLTKTEYADEGTYYSFTWYAGSGDEDRIAVQIFSKDGAENWNVPNQIKFKAKETSATSTFEQDGNTYDLTTEHTTEGYSNKDFILGTYAFYPKYAAANNNELSYSHASGTVSLNDNSPYSGTVAARPSSVIPLIGKKSSGDGTPDAVYTFKNVTGALKLSVKSIPAGATKLVITANGAVDKSNGKNVITGTWELSDALYDDGLTMSNVQTGYNTKTITFSKITDADFYVPIPAGTLEGLSIELLDNLNNRLYYVSTDSEIAISRSSIKSLTDITCKSASVWMNGTATAPVLNYNQNVGYIYANVSKSSTNTIGDYPYGLSFSNSGYDSSYSNLTTAFSSLFSGSGMYYLHFVALSSKPANEDALHGLTMKHKTVKTYGTIPFYYITSDDLNRVMGTYSVITVGQATSIQDLKIKVSDNCGAGSIRMRYFYNYDQLVGTGIYGYVEGTNATFFSGQHFRTNSSGDNNFFMGYGSWNGSAFVNTADVVFSIGGSDPQVLSKTSPAIVADVSFNPIANYPTSPKSRAEFTSVTATRKSSDEPVW